MPKPILWECEFCENYWSELPGFILDDTYEDVKLHEENCKYNPKNKTCYTCQRFSGERYPFNFKCSIGYSDKNMFRPNCPWWEPKLGIRKNMDNSPV